MPDTSDNGVMNHSPSSQRTHRNKRYKNSNKSKVLGKALEVRDYCRIPNHPICLFDTKFPSALSKHTKLGNEARI